MRASDESTADCSDGHRDANGQSHSPPSNQPRQAVDQSPEVEEKREFNGEDREPSQDLGRNGHSRCISQMFDEVLVKQYLSRRITGERVCLRH
jgi:hypothetical protein